MYNKIIWGTSPEDYQNFASDAISNAEGCLIDVGCGGLAQTYKFYFFAKSFCVLLDNSLEMLKIAQERLSILGSIPQNIKLIQADAFEIPFCSDSFETVCSFGILHLFEDKLRILQECMRVLKSGGNFYFSILVSDRLLGKFYMSLLKKEFASPSSEDDILKLFRKLNLDVKSWRKGNMLFVKGVKI